MFSRAPYAGPQRFGSLYHGHSISDDHIAPDSQDEAQPQHSFHPNQCRTPQRPGSSCAPTSTITATISTATCFPTTKSNTSRSRRMHTPAIITIVFRCQSRRVTGTVLPSTEIQTQATLTSAIQASDVQTIGSDDD
jgi:hypothetical protein